MFYARIAIATCMEAADPRNGETCPLFNAKLRLFENASAPSPPAEHPDDLTLATINSQHVPVANTTEQSIAVGDEIMVGETIDERWVVMNGGASAAPRIQFVTVAGMSGQQVAVKVLRVHGAAPDLSGGVLQFGSNINVTDPFNLWAEVELGATGWAYYVAASTDDTETTEVEPTHPARYEIEECSLPIKELEGTISECLLKEDGSAEVTIDLMSGDIRSSYPCVDEPPEVSSSGTVPANNTYNLDAISGSKVTIRRTSNHQPSTPEDYALGSGSASSHSWEITRVEKKIARWIRTVFQSGTWQYGGEGYDGFSPFGDGGCEAQITADTVECLPKSPAIGYAFYMAESHTYRVVSTKSALLGAPGKHSFIKGAESPGEDPLTTNFCGIAVRPQLQYYSKEIYGWGEEETEGCTGGGLTETQHDVDMGFGSSPALTGLSLVCGASCVWTYTNGAWVGDCSNPGCGNCTTESPLPPFPQEGDTVSGVCSNDLGESGLCFSAAYFLYCGPVTGPTPDPGPHCIPTTDCPEEEESPGGP